MTREDRKRSQPTEEELFFPGIKGEPLKNWHEGHKFYVADDKILLVLEVGQELMNEDALTIKGDTLEFRGVSSRMDAAGDITVAILLGEGDRRFRYDTGREFDSAMEGLLSNELPMLIDLQMVDSVRSHLKGKELWSRTDLWYNSNGDRIPGKKYVPVKIEDIEPGNVVFPLRLQLRDNSGDTFYMYMNFGNGDTESRAFNRLFSLTDIKKHYPGILPETWELICNGKVVAGMTKQECRLALGNPIEISSGHDYSQTLDIWTYDNGKILWFEDGKLVRSKG